MTAEDFYKCKYFVRSTKKCSIDLATCRLKRTCPYRDVQTLRRALTSRNSDCLKYIKILESVHLICRQCLDDEYTRGVMLEIIDVIEKGLE